MSPLPVYESLPYSLLSNVQLSVRPINPWKRYKLTRLRGTSSEGRKFAYYVETGEPELMSIDDLSPEFYADELQKVNAVRPDSLFRFCEKYGLPVSSGYDGAQRLTWFRKRFESTGTPFAPVLHPYGFGPNPNLILLKTAEKEIDHEFCGNTPYLLSEEARRIHLDDPEVVGAVSEAELIQTVRALQTSLALSPIINYALQNRNLWGATSIAKYLQERSHLSPYGPTYFFRADNEPLLDGCPFLPYEVRLNDDSDFRAATIAGEAEGFNTRAAYASSLGAGLVLAYNNCIAFLDNSLSVYRAPINVTSSDQPRSGKNGLSAIWQKSFDRMRSLTNVKQLDAEADSCLPAAIITQFATILNDPAEWRTCENCGRAFKKYREEKPGRVIQKTRFCKKSCATQYSKKKSQGLITE